MMAGADAQRGGVSSHVVCIIIATGTAQKDAMSEQNAIHEQIIRQRIGKYKIEDFIFQGASSTIYLAWQEELQRHVAIKIPLFRFDEATNRVKRVSRTMTDRLIDEARILSRLEYSNVIPLYDAGTAELKVTGRTLEVPYYVMRYASAGHLGERVQNSGLPANEVFAVAADLAGAIDYMHAQHILHRDLKPRDILFDAFNIPYIGNFGVATQTDPNIGTVAQHTISDEERQRLFDEPEIIAPEIWQGGPHSRASDIYAFACTIYFALAGRFPFDRRDMDHDAVRHAHLHVEPPSISTHNPTFPPLLDSIFARALSKNPTQRYSTAQGFVEAARTAYEYGSPSARTWDIFISHSKRDMAEVTPLLKELRFMGHRPWYDKALEERGGQSWWENILANIRRCEVTLFVMSNDALNSLPCTAELNYAQAVGRHVLPVRIDADVKPDELRESLATLQFVDKLQPGWQVNLRKSLDDFEEPPAVPHPLPEPPPVPVSVLARIAERIDNFGTLSRTERLATILELNSKLLDPDYNEKAVKLLRNLDAREDCDPESRTHILPLVRAYVE